MAFLCPVRIKRNKKKKPLDDDSLTGPVPSMGRITGSASIETLVRVGIEKENGLGPESKMVVLHDFTPCVDDELEVKRGHVVHVLYQENDWVYVISENNQEGFIPHSYCAPYGSQLAGLALNVKKKLPRDPPPANQTQQQQLQQQQQTTVIPSQASGGSSNSGGGRQQPLQQQQQQQQSRFGSSNPPPDVLNTAAHVSNGIRSVEHHDPNMTMATTITSTSAGGRVNPGMEHSDSDSFPDNIRHGFANRVPVDPSRSNSLMSETSSQPDIHPFFKDPSGRYVVLYSYTAQDENDLSVERGQCVTVLNSDDPDWYWVSKFDGLEGFVPSGFIYPLDAIQRQQGINRGQPRNNVPNTFNIPPHNYPMSMSTNGLPPPGGMSQNQQQQPYHPQSQKMPMQQPWSGGSASSSGPPSFSNPAQANNGPAGPNNVVGLISPPPGGPHQQQQPNRPLMSPTSSSGPPTSNSDFQPSYNGTELVMLYDYKAQAPDDLTVRRGDWVYADLSNQTVDGWLWSYAPKSRKYGFIPRAYAKPPAMTSL